jgi:hypothetical protein
MTVYDSLHSLLVYESLLLCFSDLVPIYESVTSSASVVRWITLHSWTLNFSRILLRPNYDLMNLLCPAPYIVYR